MAGFEPATFRLLSECSTPKLHWLGVEYARSVPTRREPLWRNG